MIEQRIATSFAAQPFMGHLGARLDHASGGACRITLPRNEALTQQHGFVHAGAIGAIADTAAGYAALSLWPPDADVLTIEYKLNLLAPGQRELVAVGEVVRPGKTVTVCESRVYSRLGADEALCAIALVSLMRRELRPVA